MICRPRCIMKPVIEPASAEDDDRAALLVDPGAGADLALDDEVAAAQRGAGQRARVALDHDDAGHHVLARRPADAAVDLDLGPVDDAAARSSRGCPSKVILQRVRIPTPSECLAPGLQHGDVLDPLLVDQPAQLEVDLTRRQSLARRTSRGRRRSRPTRGTRSSSSTRPRGSKRASPARCTSPGPYHHLALVRVVGVDLVVDARRGSPSPRTRARPCPRPRRGRAAWPRARPWPSRARPR